MNAPTKETPLRRRFPMPWQHMSAAKLEQEYSPSSCVDDIMVYLNDYTNYSKEAQNNLSYQSNLAYSDTMGEVLDYFPAATGGPLVVYIHGAVVNLDNWDIVVMIIYYFLKLLNQI